MIANDPRRSLEFFQKPVEAGREARAYPLAVGQILSLHILRAILLAVFSYLTYQKMDSGVDLGVSSPDAEQMAMSISVVLDRVYSSPFILTVISFLSSLLMTTFYWQIGRALSGVKISWVEAQSGLMRYLIVAAVISVIPNLFEIISGASLFVLLSVIVAIYLFINMIRVLQGVMELTGIGQSIAVIFLSALAMMGVLFLISIIFSIGV